MIGARGPVGAGDVEQSGEAGTAALAHDREPLDDKGAVEPDQRHDIGNGRERHKVERSEQIRAFAAVPEACVAQSAIERDERHEDDARGAEIAEAGEVVLTVGIDERRRLRQHLRRLMMIEHDHVKAKLAGDLERLAADGAAVDGHHKRRASRREILNGFDIGAITLGHAVGDVDDRLQSAGVQKFAEQRRAARAVDVVVAEDRDLLMGHDRALETLGRRLHIAQAKGVGHEIAEARSQMAFNRLWRDAAPCKHPGDQFVVSANLRNGERAHFSCRVKPRPPRLSERRGLYIEEVIGERQNSALDPATRQRANHWPQSEP